MQNKQRSRDAIDVMDDRHLAYRRDYRAIYATTFALCLVVLPVVRLATLAVLRRGRRPSLVAQARAEAGIVAECALMGF